MAVALNHTMEASMSSETQMIVLGIEAVVGIIILFAQVKLFSIAPTLDKNITQATLES
jgi:hypothetical protein